VGIKGVMNLPEQVLAGPVHLTGDEGVAYAIVGDCTQGIAVELPLHQRASISLGVVLRLDDLTRSGKLPATCTTTSSPPVHRPLLEAASRSIRLPPRLGGRAQRDGRIVTDGMVVVGTRPASPSNTGLTVRGMDLAAASGIAAAKRSTRRSPPPTPQETGP